MSMRRLPPGDNPFRPVRCRDVALFLLLLCAAFWTGAGFLMAWLAGAL